MRTWTFTLRAERQVASREWIGQRRDIGGACDQTPRSKRVTPRPHRMALCESAKLSEFLRRQRAMTMRQRRELEANVVAEHALGAIEPAVPHVGRGRRDAALEHADDHAVVVADVVARDPGEQAPGLAGLAEIGRASCR